MANENLSLIQVTPNSVLTAAATSTLSASEREQLASCEAMIAAQLKNYYALGRAIREVRDSRLYREQFDSIEEYGEVRWDLKKAYLYQLMDAAEVYDHLHTIAEILPSNEYQARQLAKLSPDDQRLVWKYVVDAAGSTPITAKRIKAAITDLITVEDDNEGPTTDDETKPITEFPKHAVRTLIISDILSDNPAVAADKLRDVLSHSALSWADDCHLLVVSRCVDSCALLAVLDEYSFEIGTPLVWEQATLRRPIPWSFCRSEIQILHARRGKASVSEELSNLVECNPGSREGKLPFALVQLLIKSTTMPGDLVAAAGSLSVVQMAAEQIGRSVFSIRPEPENRCSDVA